MHLKEARRILPAARCACAAANCYLPAWQLCLRSVTDQSHAPPLARPAPRPGEPENLCKQSCSGVGCGMIQDESGLGIHLITAFRPGVCCTALGEQWNHMEVPRRHRRPQSRNSMIPPQTAAMWHHPSPVQARVQILRKRSFCPGSSFPSKNTLGSR